LKSSGGEKPLARDDMGFCSKRGDARCKDGLERCTDKGNDRTKKTFDDVVLDPQASISQAADMISGNINEFLESAKTRKVIIADEDSDESDIKDLAESATRIYHVQRKLPLQQLWARWKALLRPEALFRTSRALAESSPIASRTPLPAGGCDVRRIRVEGLSTLPGPKGGSLDRARAGLP